MQKSSPNAANRSSIHTSRETSFLPASTLSSQWTRRQWLSKTGCGMGALALAQLLLDEKQILGNETLDASKLDPMFAKPTHFPAKAKQVIWIFVNGGPSQVDTWDYKPGLEKWNGKSIMEFDGAFDNTTGFFKNAVGGLMRSPFKFSPQGECGKMVSEIFPNLGKHVDKMAFIHSGHTESNNHSPALFAMNTGMARMGFPCVGSWVTYGLGSESRNLPGFVVMSDPKGRGLPKGHAANWSSGFLPGVFQGTHLKPSGPAIDNLQMPSGMSTQSQRQQLDLLKQLNQTFLERQSAESELTARIESFELAYRMQVAAPEALDIQLESAETLAMYGVDKPECDHFARQCLTARRLVERGVRFVQIYSGGMENQRSWDGHSDIKGNHSQFAGETDQPVAALLEDLAQRGLLAETLVVWCGEFGRLPVAQISDKPGRDHNPHCFTAWLAGGGVKGGTSYGESDEVGYKAAVDKVHINDLHATILHLLGMDHLKLTFRYNGRDFRLTDVGGKVLKPILA